MTWLLAPENDYRGIAPVDDASIGVTVVLPVYNRVGLLARTVAGLAQQRYRGKIDVVVADDGSNEDVEAALASLRKHLDLTIVRREHQGYGAGHARNLGARTATSGTLIFLDADCIPDPELVARHMSWQAVAENLVVIGSRHPLDATDVKVTELVAGGIDLRELAIGGRTTGAERLLPADWRRLLYRRTGRLKRGTEAYRSLVSSNFSVSRERFLEVGGFDEEFQRWGGEDTELGWRLASAGLFFVPEDRAIVYHQTQEDAGPEDWREAARKLNDGIIRSKIPHRFYRSSSRPGIRYQVPKISVVVGPVSEALLEPTISQLVRQNFADWEAILIGSGPALRLMAEELVGDQRFRFVDATDGGDDGEAIRSALAQARGELVAVLPGGATTDHRVLGRTSKLLDQRPRASCATVGYRVAANGVIAEYLRRDDIAQVDRQVGTGTLPGFRVVRRREVTRALRATTTLEDWWSTLADLVVEVHLREVSVGFGLGGSEPPPMGASPSLPQQLHQADNPRAAVKAVAEAVQRRTVRIRTADRMPMPGPQPAAGELPATDERYPMRYVGWVGHDNLGDEVLFDAIGELLPWAKLVTTGDPSRCALLGGGTLINRGYLQQLERMDSPRIERVVFGTGVANPEYWGRPREAPADWLEYLGTCAYVGVRGPISEQILREWGYRGELEVVGDPALAVAVPAVARETDRVVLNIATTGGQLWGGDDAAVYAQLAEVCRRLIADGRDVHLLSCTPRDDLDGLELMRAAGAPDLPYVAGYRDRDAAMELLASANLVVAERLHAVVLAAACSTPFLALEYRPKLRDFAASVGATGQVVRTDRVDATDVLGRIAASEARWEEHSQGLREHVTSYRARLQGAGDRLRKALM